MLCFSEEDAGTLLIQGERFSKRFRSIDFQLQYCTDRKDDHGIECATEEEQKSYWNGRKINIMIIFDLLMVDLKNKDQPMQNITKIHVQTIR